MKAKFRSTANLRSKCSRSLAQQHKLSRAIRVNVEGRRRVFVHAWRPPQRTRHSPNPAGAWLEAMEGTCGDPEDVPGGVWTSPRALSPTCVACVRQPSPRQVANRQQTPRVTLLETLTAPRSGVQWTDKCPSYQRASGAASVSARPKHVCVAVPGMMERRRGAKEQAACPAARKEVVWRTSTREKGGEEVEVSRQGGWKE